MLYTVGMIPQVERGMRLHSLHERTSEVCIHRALDHDRPHAHTVAQSEHV